MSICVLDCPPDQSVVLHGSPTRDDVRRYVSEHNRRVREQEPLGYHEHLDTQRTTPFFGSKVVSARVFSSREDYVEGKSSGRAIKISDLDA